MTHPTTSPIPGAGVPVAGSEALGGVNTLTIEPAAYRKGFSVLRTPGDGSGFKTPMMYKIEDAGGKWVHRSKGYVMPSKKACRVFLALTQQALIKPPQTPPDASEGQKP